MMDNKTFYDILKSLEFLGGGSGGGQPVVVKRTVYGTKDGEAYMCKDGAVYRVRGEKNNNGGN